jgi:predicted HAD superfamily phosphohydrolase YqeG
MEMIKQRCFAQGFDTNLILNTLHPLGRAIKEALAEYQEENPDTIN